MTTRSGPGTPVRTIVKPKNSAPERQPARSVWASIRLDPAIRRALRGYLEEAGTTAATLKARAAGQRSALARKRRAERRREAIRRTLENYPATPTSALAALYRVSERTIGADLAIIRRERADAGRCPTCGRPLAARRCTRKKGETIRRANRTRLTLKKGEAHPIRRTNFTPEKREEQAPCGVGATKSRQRTTP